MSRNVSAGNELGFEIDKEGNASGVDGGKGAKICFLKEHRSLSWTKAMKNKIDSNPCSATALTYGLCRANVGNVKY